MRKSAARGRPQQQSPLIVMAESAYPFHRIDRRLLGSPKLVSVEPSSQPETKTGGSSFWTSLPGLLTAISGLLTALVAVGAFIYQIDGSDKDDASAAAGATPTSATRVTGSPAPASSPGVAAETDAPLWHNTLIFTNDGVDFDTDPPNTKPGGGLDVYDAGNNQISPGGNDARVAKWTGSGTPTAADCADLLTREGILNTDSVPKFYEGAKFCLRTNGAGKIVLITFLGQKSGNNRIDATVWAPRD